MIDTPIALALTGTDVEDPESALIVEVISAPSNGIIDASSGSAPLTLGYTPNPGFDGSDSLTFRVVDTDGAVSSDEVASIDVVTGWVPMGAGSDAAGGISNNSDLSQNPVVGWSGSWYVAWEDRSSGTWQIYIKRYDGSNWVEVGAGSATGGGISNDPVRAETPTLAFDDSGNPIVAWEAGDFASSEIFVKTFDGVSWEELTPGSASGGGISNSAGTARLPAMVVDSQGRPVLAWVDNAGAFQIYLRRLEGSTWVEVGGSASMAGVSANSTASNWPSVAVDASDNPVVAWVDNNGPGVSDIYVKHFNGATWEPLGTGAASGGGMSNTSGWSQRPEVRVAPSGDVLVFWGDNSPGYFRIYCRKYDDPSWSNVAPWISDTSGWSEEPVPAFDTTGAPVVTWQKYVFSTPETDVYLKRFDGMIWEELPTGSASAGGLSNNAGHSRSPYLAFNPTGQAVVAWSDNASGNVQIYVKMLGIP